MTEFPIEGVELTFLLVVSDLDRSVRFYRDILGATLTRTHGGTSAVLRFQESWLLLVTGGEPTADKPTITFEIPADPDRVNHELTIRVPDCHAAYEILRDRGAAFLTPPVEYDWGNPRVFSPTRTATYSRSAKSSSGDRARRLRYFFMNHIRHFTRTEGSAAATLAASAGLLSPDPAELRAGAT